MGAVINNQVVRYAMVGISSNALGYSLYLILTHFFFSPEIAVTILYPIGTLISYLGNRSFTFSSKENGFASGLRFLLAYLLGFFLNLWLLWYFSDLLGYPHQWIQAIAIFVVAGFLFVAMRYFVFKGVAHA